MKLLKTVKEKSRNKKKTGGVVENPAGVIEGKESTPKETQKRKRQHKEDEKRRKKSGMVFERSQRTTDLLQRVTNPKAKRVTQKKVVCVGQTTVKRKKKKTSEER